MRPASEQRVPAGKAGERLIPIYHCLLKHFGPQHWWPGETPFEVMVGAILTQNTNWGNVEKAIANLRAAGVLSPRKLAACTPEKLAGMVRPSGYFNVKAKRLKAFLNWLVPRMTGDSIPEFKGIPTATLREELLRISGIGPETADSILLYALGRRTFVVDAYTRRFVERHGLIRPGATYDEIKLLFENNLPRSIRLYNEYHALIVRLGKECCRPSEKCENCPIRGDRSHEA